MKAIHPASILVTDDESNIRLMLRIALESEGYLVREAANGRQALEAVHQLVPDLMVLDLNMPELDGMAVLDQMKSLATKKKPRVIILTAYGSIPTAVKAMSLGASDFIEKPVSPAVLRETVRSILEEPQLDRMAISPEMLDAYEGVLDRVRKSLRLADVTSAQALLLAAANQRNQYTAEYFNLLGVLYEAQGNWRMARKCYSQSIDAARTYAPAKSNMIRLNQLRTHGHSTQPVALGDEADDLMFARLPETRG